MYSIYNVLFLFFWLQLTAAIQNGGKNCQIKLKSPEGNCFGVLGVKSITKTVTLCSNWSRKLRFAELLPIKIKIIPAEIQI